MAKKVITKNTNIIIGEVFNVKITPFKSNKGAIVNLGVRDRLHNNIIYVNLTDYGRGIRYNGNDYTPQALKNIFLDENEKSRNILVKAIAEFEENKYTNKNGIECVSARYNVRKIDAFTNSEKQNITFTYKGYVKGYKETDDNIKIRLALPKVDRDMNMSGVNSVTVEATDPEVIESISPMDIEKGCIVSVKGYILNTVEYDEFGDKIKDDKYNSIVKIDEVIEADEDGVEEFVEQLKKANKLETGMLLTSDGEIVNAKEYYASHKPTNDNKSNEVPVEEKPKTEEKPKETPIIEDDDLGELDF